MIPAPNLLISGYEISFEPITDHLIKKLSPEEIRSYASLVELAQNSPGKAFIPSVAFKDKYPHLPEALNLLAFVYAQLKKIARAEALIQEAYEKNPDYLFARINFADQCLRKKQPGVVPKIFNLTFELKHLYPRRKIFHVSEFRGFMVVMGFYHIAIGNRSAAIDYYRAAAEADPGHPSVWALEKKLFKFRFFKKILKRLEKLACNPRIS